MIEPAFLNKKMLTFPLKVFNVLLSIAQRLKKFVGLTKYRQSHHPAEKFQTLTEVSNGYIEFCHLKSLIPGDIQ